MKYNTFTQDELTYFANFILNLAQTMKDVPGTKGKLEGLGNKFMPPRSYVDLSLDEAGSSVALIRTSLTSIKAAGEKGVDNKEQAAYLEKVSTILTSIEEKLNKPYEISENELPKEEKITNG